jgi:hypothetical protein
MILHTQPRVVLGTHHTKPDKSSKEQVATDSVQSVPCRSRVSSDVPKLSVVRSILRSERRHVWGTNVYDPERDHTNFCTWKPRRIPTSRLRSTAIPGPSTCLAHHLVYSICGEQIISIPLSISEVNCSPMCTLAYETQPRPQP